MGRQSIELHVREVFAGRWMEGNTVDAEDTVEKGRSVGIVQVDLQKTLADLRREINEQVAKDGNEVPPKFAFVEKLRDQLVEISAQEESLILVKDLVGKEAEILIVEKPAEITIVTTKKTSTNKNSGKPKKEAPKSWKLRNQSLARNQRERVSDEDNSDSSSPRKNKESSRNDQNNRSNRNDRKEDSLDGEDMKEAWYTSASLRRQLRQLRREREQDNDEDDASAPSPRKPRRKSRGRTKSRRERQDESMSPRPRDRNAIGRTTRSKSRPRPRSTQRRPRSSRQNTFRLPQLVRTSQAIARFERNINRLEKKEEQNEENESNGSGERDEENERPATVRIRRERSLTEEVRIPQVSSSGRRLPSLRSQLRKRSYSIDGGGTGSDVVEGYFTPDSPTMDEYFLTRQPFSYSALNLRELEKKQVTRLNNRFEVSKMESRVRGLLGRVRAIEDKIKLLKSIGQEHWRGRFYQLRRNVAPLEERAKQLEDEEDELEENLIRLFQLKKPVERYTSLFANDFQKNALMLAAQKVTSEITRLNNQLENIDLDLLKYRKMRKITEKQAEEITQDINREKFLRHLFLGRTFQKN